MKRREVSTTTTTMADFGGFLRSDFGKLFFPENRHNTEPKTTEKPFVAILLNLTGFCAFPYRTNVKVYPALAWFSLA